MFIMPFQNHKLRQWLNPLSANRTKWSNTLKQFAGKLLTNCLSVFDYFIWLALKVLNIQVVCCKSV